MTAGHAHDCSPSTRHRSAANARAARLLDTAHGRVHSRADTLTHPTDKGGSFGRPNSLRSSPTCANCFHGSDDAGGGGRLPANSLAASHCRSVKLTMGIQRLDRWVAVLERLSAARTVRGDTGVSPVPTAWKAGTHSDTTSSDSRVPGTGGTPVSRSRDEVPQTELAVSIAARTAHSSPRHCPLRELANAGHRQQVVRFVQLRHGVAAVGLQQ